MKRSIKCIAILMLSSALCACATSRPALSGQDNSFGASNHANIQAHAITPDPALKADTYIPADRERVRAARESYRNGEVKEPKEIGLQSN